jgi:hypothetical protein
MDKETYQALKCIIDRLRSFTDMEDDDIERVAEWIDEVAKDYAD